jgi:MFS family permease
MLGVTSVNNLAYLAYAASLAEISDKVAGVWETWAWCIAFAIPGIAIGIIRRTPITVLSVALTCAFAWQVTNVFRDPAFADAYSREMGDGYIINGYAAALLIAISPVLGHLLAGQWWRWRREDNHRILGGGLNTPHGRLFAPPALGD